MVLATHYSGTDPRYLLLGAFAFQIALTVILGVW